MFEHCQATVSLLGIYRQTDVSFTVWVFVRVVRECEGEDTPRKLVIESNCNFRELLSEGVEHVELFGAAKIEETATQLTEDSQASEQASLFTVALPRSVRCSNVLL
jgi:hypothetical protein